MATSVGYATLQIIPSTAGFTSALSAQTSAGMVTAGKTGAKGFGASFLGGVKGFAGPMAAIMGGAAVFGFAKSAVSEASNLNESLNALRVTYGQASDEVVKLGQEAADSLGLSRVEFGELAVRFGAFAKTISGPGGDVVGTLDDLTTRAADFASVMNLDVAEAAQLFQSGLAGETEPLRRFGVDVSAATTAAYAYAKGLAKPGEPLTEQQKIMARYGAIMEQTKKTQGDFANTSDQLANQQRILGARWDNLKATLGSALLPAITSVVTALNNGVGAVMGWIQGLGSFDGALSGTGGALSGIMKNLQPAIDAFMDLARTIGEAAKPILERLMSVLKKDVFPTLKKFFTALSSVVGPILRISAAALKLQVKIAAILIPVILKVAGPVFRVLIGAISTVIGWVGKIVGKIADFAEALQDPESAVRRMVTTIRQKIGDVVGFFADLPGKILDKVGEFGTLLWDAGRALVQGLLDGIKSLASAPVDAIKGIGSAAVDGVKSVLHINSPSRVFADIGENVVKGFVLGVDRNRSEAQGAMTRAVAPPRAPKLKGGVGVVDAVASGGPLVRQPVILTLDGRTVAETVFEIGGREYAYGRRV